MDELRYQVDLLNAMNKKLADREKMYRMICDMSSCAYLYVSVKEQSVKVLGNWQAFFCFHVQNISDIDQIYHYVDELDATKLARVLDNEDTD